ncbi:metallophosphoesterase [bacterium]|nr:metallophosphoesterase [bacterium]
MHILYTNDLHNQVAPLSQLPQWQRPDSVLLDGGDAIGGSNTAFRWQEPILQWMRRLGYAAMAMGNREFHYWRWLHRWREQERQFPLLACNLEDLRDHRTCFRPWTTLRHPDLKVAVIGTTPVQFPVGSFWERKTGWRFLDPMLCLPPLVEELKASHDGVVLLSHCGLEHDLKLADRGLGVDLILGAHSHDLTPEPVYRGGTGILQTGSHGRYFAEIEWEPGRARLGWTLHSCS